MYVPRLAARRVGRRYDGCVGLGIILRRVAIRFGRNASLQEAVYWLNIQLELLAADERALRRMRNVMAVHAGAPDAFEEDLQLLMIEIDRVMSRLKHWEAMVDRLRVGSRR
jgi:hypothetical protein